MSLPWGVKESVEPEAAVSVETYVAGIAEQELSLPSGNNIKVLKGAVKERKGNYILIVRYQITNVEK
jgi:hypothetical protein